MKKLLLMFAAVATLFTACNNNEPEHIYDDHSADLVGTWTCLTANYAEALIINADGTAVSYGVEDGEYWENVNGTVAVNGGNIVMTFEDNDNFTGHFDIIPNQSFSRYNDKGERYVYQYCANDLADEIVGMWVCTETPSGTTGDMMIQTFDDNSKAIYTGFEHSENGMTFNNESKYKVVGDLNFLQTQHENTAFRLVYNQNATSLGDVMTFIAADSKLTATWLRVKQSLDLANQSYDYNNIFVSNVKGEDKDIEFMGYTMNFANMNGSKLDAMLKSILFHIEFPEANTISYSYNMGNKKETYNAPVVVEGNKLTVKMSSKVPTLKDVVFYAFQDVDDCQMHIYMSKSAFVNFYTNMQAMLLKGTDEQFDINNAEAVDAIYNSINSVVESINLSLVMKAAK